MPGPTPTPTPTPTPGIPQGRPPFIPPTPTPTPGYPSGPSATPTPTPMPQQGPTPMELLMALYNALMQQGSNMPFMPATPRPQPQAPGPTMSQFPWMMPQGAGPQDFVNPMPNGAQMQDLMTGWRQDDNMGGQEYYQHFTNQHPSMMRSPDSALRPTRRRTTLNFADLPGWPEDLRRRFIEEDAHNYFNPNFARPKNY